MEKEEKKAITQREKAEELDYIEYQKEQLLKAREALIAREKKAKQEFLER